ncbi:unnamed protein product, partial [Polarella glacialis]
ASGDQEIVSDLGHVIDLNYLTHIVFRCYERDCVAEERAAKRVEVTTDEVEFRDTEHEACSPPAWNERLKSHEKARYRVEISISPGVQVFKGKQHVQWPRGSELCEVEVLTTVLVFGPGIREMKENCMVAPLEIIGKSVELEKVEKFLTEVIKEYGASNEDDETADEKGSDAN